MGMKHIPHIAFEGVHPNQAELCRDRWVVMGCIDIWCASYLVSFYQSVERVGTSLGRHTTEWVRVQILGSIPNDLCRGKGSRGQQGGSREGTTQIQAGLCRDRWVVMGCIVIWCASCLVSLPWSVGRVGTSLGRHTTEWVRVQILGSIPNDLCRDKGTRGQ